MAFDTWDDGFGILEFGLGIRIWDLGFEILDAKFWDRDLAVI